MDTDPDALRVRSSIMVYRKSLPPVAALLTATAASGQPFEYGPREAPHLEPAYPSQTQAPVLPRAHAVETAPIAEGLEHPWAIAEMPDGGFLVTERPGRLRHVAADGTISDPIAGVPEVENRAPETGWSTQAGLLDVKLGPDFGDTRHIYFTYAKPVEDDMSVTAAARGTLNEDMTELTGVEDIFVQSPPSPTRMHYGSRIVFDGRGHAFITTGEHSALAERDFAQHLDTTYGKIVRVNLDGSIPDSNPFTDHDRADPAIWSYGHRNVQGAAMHEGMLWTIEHGPAGGDELNLPLPGRNYGWPIVSYGVRYNGPSIGTGEARMAGFQEPLYFWDPVIAPGDMVFYEGDAFPAWEGDILAAALVTGGLVRLDMNGTLVAGEGRLLSDLGRVRDVEVLDDGTLAVATDFEDGAIIHVTPAPSN